MSRRGTDPGLFIVILNWNGWRDTVSCLDSLFRTGTPPGQVVVVDNGSTDASLVRIEQWAVDRAKSGVPPSPATPLPILKISRQQAECNPDNEALGLPADRPCLVLIETGANLGFAAGNNVGIRYARARGAEYLLLLNNDAWFRTPDGAAHMVEFLERTPDAGACGARLFYPDGRPQLSFGNFPAPLRTLAWLFPLHRLLPSGWLAGLKRSNVVPDDAVTEPLKVDWPSGACLMVRSRTIDQVGLMDERYFLYLEETDWCLRMRARNWERYYLPQVEVLHRFGGSVEQAPQSMQRYHLASQFTYFGKHCRPAVLALLRAGYALRATFSLLGLLSVGRLAAAKRRAVLKEREGYWRLALRLALEPAPARTPRAAHQSEPARLHSQPPRPASADSRSL